ncbi:MAG: hypothetical protein KAI71_02420 [Candidatus Pacebacteria bacterium]|nr:hypothetical protein [Candidatus Paceibacterota bacterium]
MYKKSIFVVMMAIIAIIATVVVIAASSYEDWKEMPENRDPYHIEGVICDMENDLPAKDVSVTVSDETGRIFETKTNTDGMFSFDILACILCESQYQTISTETVDHDSVDSISQVMMYDVWMCSDPWIVSIKIEKDGYSSIEETFSLGKEGGFYNVFISKIDIKDRASSWIALYEKNESEFVSEKFSNAEFWLNSARAEPELFKIDFVRDNACKANISLEELGTSNDELLNLERQAYISNAEFWLESARNDPELFKIDFVRDNACKANISLEELGTSNDELLNLERQARINNAEFWLNSARAEPELFKIDFVRDNAYYAYVSIEYIGTSNDELLNLERQARINNAEFWLNSARAEPELFKIDFIRDNACKANISLEKLGTSNDELLNLERMANGRKKTIAISSSPSFLFVLN